MSHVRIGRRADVRVVCWWVWMVVRFVSVIRVPLCASVSRVCPVCVPAPPGVPAPREVWVCGREWVREWVSE